MDASGTGHAIQTRWKTWYGSNSQNVLAPDSGEQADGDGSANSQVLLSVDEIDLKRNKTPRETQNIPGERERELTVHPVAPLLVLVRRSIETSLVFLRDLLRSIAPSIARACGQHRAVVGITTVPNAQGLLLSHQPRVAIPSTQLPSSTPTSSIPGLPRGTP